MPRKTHKRQRKQNGGLGYDYISSKTEILRKVVGLDDEVIKSDNIEYLITKDGFENSMKGSLFGFIMPDKDTVCTQLIEYITVLYTIIVGNEENSPFTSFLTQKKPFPELQDSTAREIEFGKIRGTVLVEDGTQKNQDTTGWFKRFIDNYKVATDLYRSVSLTENPNERIKRETEEQEREQRINENKVNIKQRVQRRTDEENQRQNIAKETDDLPGIEQVDELESNDTNTTQQSDQSNTNSPYDSPYNSPYNSPFRDGGKRKQKSNKHRRKSNRRKSNRR